MRVLFTADLHIKLGQRNVPRVWQTNRYLELFDYLNEMSKSVDLLILGGDIFDKRPNTEEISLYVQLIQSLACNTIVFDGNHEAEKKGDTWLTDLASMTLLINNNVKIIHETTTLYGIQFLPYCRLHKELKTIKPESNILVTHVRGDIPPYVKAEVDLELFDAWEVVFAGDLHAQSNSQRNIVYPGSPLTTSFHRGTVDTGIIIFDTDNPRDYEFVKLELPQLIRKTVEREEDIKPSAYDHTIYELVGSTADLVITKDNELLDKKIVVKESEAKLDLSTSTSISEEINIYCKEVLKLEEDKIKDILTMYMNII